MAMRLTGMYSGLDTETIIKELVKSKSVKVDNLKKEQTSYEWKQEAWTSLNTKLKSFQSALSNLRFSSSYKKKTTSVSNPNAVSIITGEGALNGVQELRIHKLAKSGYMTGASLKSVSEDGLSQSTALSDLRFKADADGKEISGLTALTAKGGSFSVTVGDKTTKINVKADSTISEVVSQMRSAGVDVNFDEKQGRIYMSSSTSGFEKDFAITADNAEGFTALSLLGINKNLGTSTDTSVNSNAKTLATYQKLAAFNSALSGLGYKTVEYEEEVEKTREVNKLDEDGNPIQKMDEDGNPVVDEEGNPVYETVTETYTETETKTKEVIDTEAFLGALDTKSDLYKAIKAELPDPDKEPTAEEMDAAIERLKEKAAFATEITKAGSAYTDSLYTSDAVRIAGSDAEITLNGVDYTSNSNNVEVAGITFTCLAVSEDPITVTTQDDTDGIYDMIKDIFKQYNEVINEMDKLYNAENASKYKPLTDEEKDEMTEKEIEKWEQKIKDSILRRDTNINTISSGLKSIFNEGIEIKGTKYYLSNFGIETLSYFSAPDNQKNAFHIAGDPDDKDTAALDDKLKSAIANNTEDVISFFVELSRNLYKKMDDLSASSDYSSKGSFFEDKKYKSDLNDYATKIKEAEAKLTAYEDKYYKRFSDMEVALSKLESSTSSITSLLGGGN